MGPGACGRTWGTYTLHGLLEWTPVAVYRSDDNRASCGRRGRNTERRRAATKPAVDRRTPLIPVVIRHWCVGGWSERFSPTTFYPHAASKRVGRGLCPYTRIHIHLDFSSSGYQPTALRSEFSRWFALRHHRRVGRRHPDLRMPSSGPIGGGEISTMGRDSPGPVVCV